MYIISLHLRRVNPGLGEAPWQVGRLLTPPLRSKSHIPPKAVIALWGLRVSTWFSNDLPKGPSLQRQIPASVGKVEAGHE